MPPESAPRQSVPTGETSAEPPTDRPTTEDAPTDTDSADADTAAASARPKQGRPKQGRRNARKDRDRPKRPSAAPLEATPGCIPVGRINSTWGLRGHVRITPLTSNPERFDVGQTLIVRGKPCEIRDVQRPKGYPIVQFAGYQTPEAAERLRDTFVEIRAGDLPELPAGQHYIHDLLGLAVVTEDGEDIGTLADVIETGANDVYLVRRAGKRDVLIPAIADVVRSVDIAAGRVTIDPLPGLLDG